MTTAWAHAVRGDAAAALRANAGGAVLCGVVAVAAVWAAALAVAGDWIWIKPSSHWLLWIGAGWLTMTILDWARRIASG
jgi:xanthine/CO dehydrogenase XdhC/CoxF family maturation factor